MRIGLRIGRAVVLIVAVLTCIGLVATARTFKVAREGASPEYWEHACGVQIPGFKGHWEYASSGGALPEVGAQLYYYDQHHHGQILYSVPTADVLQDVPVVKELLRSEIPPDSASCTESWRSRCEWYERGAPRRQACRALLDPLDPTSVTTATLDSIRRARTTDFDAYDPERDEAFLQRLERGKRVWLTLSFEALFLAGWLAFLSWPLFRPSKLGWHWHVGMAPFLLHVPYFLGYAPMTFSHGPSGGFIYPGFLVLAALPMHLIPCTVVDKIMWEFTPQILSGLSQVPGSPLAASYFACVGPASSLLAGAVLVGIIWALRSIVRRIQRRDAVS